MRLLFFIGIILSCLSLQAQIYKPGKIVLQDGQVIDCEIRLDKWYGFQKRLTYRTKGSEEKKFALLYDIKSFEVDGAKHEKFMLPVERSYGKFYNYESDTAYYTTETLFLSYVVEGKHSLLYHQADEYELFFYKVEDGPVVQLLDQYGRFIVYNSVNYESEVHRNIKRYRRQLYDSLKIEGMSMAEYNQIEYSTTDLIPYFKKLNNNEQKRYKVGNQSQYALSIRVGSQLNHYKMRYFSFDHESIVKPEFRIGLEGEILLPMLRQNTSIFLETEYRFQKFNEFIDPADERSTLGPQELNVVYNALQFNFGMRYRFITFKGVTFYGTAQGNITHAFTNEIYLGLYRATQKNNLRLGHHFSVGAYFLEDFSAELFFGTRRILTETSIRAPIRMMFFGVKLGYKFIRSDR